MVMIVTERHKRRWDHTASIMAMIANSNLPKDATPYSAKDFHPHWAQKSDASSDEAALIALRTRVQASIAEQQAERRL